MKKSILILAAVTFIGGSSSFAQNLTESQVPAVIVNNFKQEFPKAIDIEWEKEGELYNVDFEIAGAADHEVWYDESGKALKQEVEISKKELPESVKSTVNNEFKRSWISEAKKINDDGKLAYKVEIRTLTEEWNVILDETGKVISKIAD